MMSAANRIFRVKIKKTHDEYVSHGIKDLFDLYTEEELGIKKSRVYNTRRVRCVVGDCIESDKAYIEVIPWHHSHRKYVAGIAERRELDTITSEELETMLSVKVDSVHDDEDNVWFVLNLFKLRTNTAGSVIRGVYKGCLVLGYPYEFNHCFTLRDIESMQERGLFISDTGMLLLKITYNTDKNISESASRLAEMNEKDPKSI